MTAHALLYLGLAFGAGILAAFLAISGLAAVAGGAFVTGSPQP
jgi:hypothetical protein